MKKFFLIIAATGALLAVIGYLTDPINKSEKSPLEKFAEKSKQPAVEINGLRIPVELADTEEERKQGLSDRDSLDKDSGVLFVFENGSKNPFWMKNMRFAIDIIWIKNGTILGIEKDVQPQPGISDEHLYRYYPPETVDRVLEVNAGFSEKSNIKVGDTVKLPN